MKATPAWRAASGHLAVPTLAVLGLVLLGHAAAWTLVLTGTVPLWAGALLCFVCAFGAFTPLHEAVHSNIAGRHARLRWLDTVGGWLSAALLLAPYPAYKALHLRHHAHTNDPDKDPDVWVAGGGFFAVLWRCLTITPYFYWEFLAQRTAHGSSLFRRVRALAIGALLGYIALGVGLSVAGFGLYVLWLWVVPGLCAASLLAFLLDWVPHHPHDVQGRFHDTRVIIFPGLNFLMMGHAYHLIHHLYPRVPFYSYRSVFGAMRPELEERGAPISDWKAPRPTAAVH